MADIILDNIYLILLLPLWIFLIIMSARFFAVYVNNRIIYTLTLLSSFFGVLLCSVSLIKLTLTIEQSFPFIKIGNFVLDFGLHVDKLSLIIALVLFLVSFLVQMFSVSYMKDEPKQYRYYAYLNMFNFSMAGLIFSPNLFQMYFFWELVGVMSYLLIGFDYKNSVKSEASRRVFLTNRIGDTALLGGIIFSSYLMYNYSGNLSFAALSFEDMNAITTLILAYTDTPVFYLLCILFIIGAAVKSAQFPFYTWLQDAMEAKLPVSALLHSATMVAAGAYLLIRMLPLFTLEASVLQIIAWLGILTALICSILASIETHPKKVLAYSTSANFGLMFFAIGILNVKAALIFFVAHAFIKSMLFLSIDENENFVNYITFLLGGLSLSGLIFSGVIAKEFLFVSINNPVFSVIYCLTAFLTAFYIMRISLIMVQNKKLVNRINLAKYAPIAVLFLLNIVFYFAVRGKVAYKVAEPFWAALAGWAAVYFLYTKNLLTKFDKTPKLLERFYNNGLAKIYEKFAIAMNFIDVKVFGNYKPLLIASKCGVKTAGWIEENIMNKSVTLTADLTKMLSKWGSKLQTKNIQSYNAYAFILVTIVVSLVIIAYKIMLNQIS
jgi:NAD(P)H-quinone oxidoreductase subunit 5, chloroplastic